MLNMQMSEEVGSGMDSDPYAQAYRRLQGRLLERSGADVRSRFVKVPRIGRVHVLEAGAGAPVLILHGGAGVGAEHIPLLAGLSKRFRVVLPDRPGHGLSADFDYRCDLRRANVEFITALLDELGIQRAALVGNSYGGLMSVHFSLAHPQRVSKLVILSFFPGVDRKLPLMMRLMVAPILGAVLARTVGRPTVENTRRFFSQVIVAHIDRMPEELVELEALHSRRHNRSITGLFREAFTVRGFRPRYVVGEELSRLSVPTVFLWGEHDRFLPVDEGREVAARIPGTRFVVIPDAGHLVTSDQPIETATLLERALAAG
jgi:pimeloyl-ACP methyl ester carboxylesterase